MISSSASANLGPAVSPGMSLVHKNGTRELWRHESQQGPLALKFFGSHDESLSNELEISRQVRHPNICTALSLERRNEVDVLVFPWIEGKSLALREMELRQPLLDTLGTKLMPKGSRWFFDLLSALKELHRPRTLLGAEGQWLHGDISPENILLDAKGRGTLIDFGCAHFAPFRRNTHLEQSSVRKVRGKPRYLSPEQAWADPCDARSDLFSLALVLLETRIESVAIGLDAEDELLRAQEANWASWIELAPRSEQDFFRRALAVDPKDRFQDASSMSLSSNLVL